MCKDGNEQPLPKKLQLVHCAVRHWANDLAEYQQGKQSRNLVLKVKNVTKALLLAPIMCNP